MKSIQVAASCSLVLAFLGGCHSNQFLASSPRGSAAPSGVSVAEAVKAGGGNIVTSTSVATPVQPPGSIKADASVAPAAYQTLSKPATPATPKAATPAQPSSVKAPPITRSSFFRPSDSVNDDSDDSPSRQEGGTMVSGHEG